MVEGLAEKATGWLKRFDEAIDETDEHYDRLERGGKYDPGAPYMLKYEIGYALDYLKSGGANVDGMEREYLRICGKLQSLEGKRGRDYRLKLCGELLMDVDSYRLGDGLFELTPVDVEAWNDMERRDFIEVLAIELKKDFDFQAVEAHIQALDKGFRRAYMERIAGYQAHHASVELPYYPERFWWRHPSWMLAGNDKNRHDMT